MRRARERLLGNQREDGSFWFPCDAGPVVPAIVHLVLRRLGYAERGDDARLERFLSQRQLADGSFADNPGGERGSLIATAAVWGALRSLDTDATRRAQKWLGDNGGLAQVAKTSMAEDPYAVAPLLAFAGVLADPGALREHYLPLVQVLLPGVVPELAKKFNVGFLLNEEWIAALVSALVARETQECCFRRWLDAREADAVVAFSKRFRNPNGSWDDSPNQTVLAIAALVAMGVKRDDPLVAEAARWLRELRVQTGDTLTYAASVSTVWDTGLCLGALTRAWAVERDEAAREALLGPSRAASRWLARASRGTCQASIDNPGSGRMLRGGWGFAAGNLRLPDSDDTGLALLALGEAVEHAELLEALGSEAEEEIDSSIGAGRQWLLGMQHSDGGWGVFSADQPRRDGGRLFQRPIGDTSGVDWTSLDSVGRFVRTQLEEMSDSSTSSLTSRVVAGLCKTGSTLEDPAVARAIEFVAGRQHEDGSFFGRWVVNYVGGTACALQALGATGLRVHDRASPQPAPAQATLRRAVDWIASRQNPDGGWGETPASYTNPSLAGRGPSMPGLTGMVLIGLLEIAYDGLEIESAVDYLLREQAPDGSWNNAGWLQVLFPPSCFYVMPSVDVAFPLQALGAYLERQTLEPGAESQKRWVAARREHADTPASITVRQPDGRWDEAGLRRTRRSGDAPADEFALRMFDRHERSEFNRWVVSLRTNSSPMPQAAPPEFAEFFRATAALPEWADEGRIARAQDFFVQHSWPIVACLFCSSLPQAYAAANGAAALIRSGGMTDKLRHRVLETAQFLFDVLSPGATTPGGCGIRAAQRVRLLHASMRTLILEQPTWDDAWGVPINQQDLAGTLLCFSDVVLEGLATMGIEVSRSQAGDWIHYWGVLGALLGLRPDLIPRSCEDAQQLMDFIRREEWRASEQGRVLAADLIAMIGEYLPCPGSEEVAAAAIRHLVGDQCAEILGLASHSLVDRFVEAGLDAAAHLATLEKPQKHAGMLQTLAEHVMEAIVSMQRGGEQARFRIPPAVRHGWKRTA